MFGDAEQAVTTINVAATAHFPSRQDEERKFLPSIDVLLLHPSFCPPCSSREKYGIAEIPRFGRDRVPTF
jgi:hypothetical protein